MGLPKLCDSRAVGFQQECVLAEVEVNNFEEVVMSIPEIAVVIDLVEILGHLLRDLSIGEVWVKCTRRLFRSHVFAMRPDKELVILLELVSGRVDDLSPICLLFDQCSHVEGLLGLHRGEVEAEPGQQRTVAPQVAQFVKCLVSNLFSQVVGRLETTSHLGFLRHGRSTDDPQFLGSLLRNKDFIVAGL